MNRLLLIFFSLLSMALLSCHEYTPVPRPFGYHRIDMPGDDGWAEFQQAFCPFTFEYPAYAKISRSMPDSCWVDLQFEPFDCKWHISYRNVPESRKSRSVHYEEYRKLIYKHSKKASRINETPISSPKGYGTLFEIYGNVGTPAQLFFSDSSGQHIAMLSFYYQTALKGDSLFPITQYMKGKIQHLTESIEWEKSN
ncbi:MAG: hypothetical protein AAF206_04185 [Bacteroidota bacterium]